MRFTGFADAAPRIAVRDAPARLPGSAQDGAIEHADTVEHAGTFEPARHPCPMATSADLTARAA